MLKNLNIRNMKKLIPVSTEHTQYSVLMLRDGFPQTQDVALLLCCNGDRSAREGSERGEVSLGFQ